MSWDDGLTPQEFWTELESRGCEIVKPIVRTGTGTVWIRPDGIKFLLPNPDPRTDRYSRALLHDLIKRMKLPLDIPPRLH
jgi:hypothetical protein